MRPSRQPIVIASRKSPLAKAQAQAVGNALARSHPAIDVRYRWIESQADQAKDVSLADVGGKGLFTRAIEQALLDGQANLAVHSLKDLPASPELSHGLVIAAVPERADVRDCLICSAANNLQELPQGARVGTASPRRAAQLLRLRPDVQIQLIRGNVQTRLGKVLQGHRYDATLLAVAGLYRAGLSQYTKYPIDTSLILPAACQGALALQCRSDDHATLKRCLPLNHSLTAAAVNAERTIVAALDGDCHSPIAVLAQPVDTPSDRHFRLTARVLSPDGTLCIEAQHQAPDRNLGQIVQKVISELRARGAVQVLAGQPVLPLPA